MMEVGQRKFLFRVRIAAGILFFICSFGFASDTKPSATPAQPTLAKANRPDLVFVQTPVVSNGVPFRRFPEGSRIVRLNAKADASGPLNLTSEFFAAADPQVDFRGAKILFSGQKVRDGKWQIWEMDADGSNKHQLTNCAQECFRPGYLPGDEIVFTVLSRDEGSGDSQLAVANSDGSGMHQITFGSADWWFETVLQDGRILASASWPLEASARKSNSRLLYTLRPDGAALDSLRCDHQTSAARGDASELEDGSIVFIEARNPAPGGGELAEIQRGALREQRVGAPTNEYRSPRQLSADQLIVAQRLRQAGTGHDPFALYLFNLQKNALGAQIYRDSHLSSLQPVLLAAHPVPKKFWSTLSLESKAGYLISLDSYSSADAPHGRVATPIASVRVFILPPGSKQEQMLGDAPVEKDGSFYVEVPADQPVRFELLDTSGQVIRAEKSWIWARPGEQRGCAGCHSDKALAPENRWPLTLKRFDTPTHLAERQNASVAKAN